MESGLIRQHLKLRLRPILLCGTLIFGSCGPKDKDKNNTNGPNLEGVWTAAGCAKQADSDPPEYFKEEVSLLNKTLSYTVRSFSDSACTVKIDTESFNSSYKTGEEAALPATTVDGAANIDLVIQSSNYTVHTDDLVAASNQKSLCSKSDWVKDVPTDLSLCAQANFRKGQSLFLVYKVTTQNLYWGLLDSTKDGSSADKRSNKLSTDPLLKQN